MKKKITIITLLMMLICANVYAATSNNEYQWSTETKSLTINDFNNIVELCVGISGEDFSTYTFTNNSDYYGSNYNEMISRLNNANFFKGFATYNNLFALIVQTNNYTYLNYNSSDSGYYSISSVVYTFDFENKIIKYYQAVTIVLNDNGETYWRYKNTTNVTLEEFQSTAYMKNMMYDSFYLIMGELYNNSSKNTLLNYKISYKVTEKEYEEQIFSGDIDFSNAFEKWITNNLSDNFKMGFYSYYLEKYDYGEDYISPNYTSREKISDVTFLSNSNYLPTIEQVNKTIKSGEAWENYIYTIALSIDDGIDDQWLLVSDMFIVDEKPISMIEHFNYKYDYINYTNYINIEEENPSSSGDNGTGSIVGDIEEGNNNYWGSQEDLNKENQENLISGEISGVMDNVSEEMQKNEVFGLLSDYHDKIWGMFQGEEDFKIEWNSVQYMGKDLIPAGNINFTEICEEEPFLYIKYIVNTIVSFGIIISLIQQIYNLILSTLGIDNPYLYEDENYMQSTDAQTGEIREKYYKNRRVYKK